MPPLVLYFAVKPVADTLSAESQLTLGVTVGAPLVELTVTEKLPAAAPTDFDAGETLSVCLLCDTPNTFVTVPDLMVTVPSRAELEPMFDAVKVKVFPDLVQVIQSGASMTVQAVPELELMVLVREPPAGGKASSVLLIEIELAAWVTVSFLETPLEVTVMVPERWLPVFAVCFTVKPVAVTFDVVSQVTLEETVGVLLALVTVTEKLPEAAVTDFEVGEIEIAPFCLTVSFFVIPAVETVMVPVR